MEPDKELSLRMDRHQIYVGRQWQYFAAFLVLQGFLLNAAKDLLNTDASIFSALAIASIITTVVFHHMILWTKIRIHRNVRVINELAGQEFIELPSSSKAQGITFWLSLSMLSFTLCWLILLYSVSGWLHAIAGIGAVALLLALSAYSSNSLLEKLANNAN